jgi:hypothetical protein
MLLLIFIHLELSIINSCIPFFNDVFVKQKEDLVYVAKLVVGSFGGAAAIKYGSAIFPEITTPNLVLALVIISTPVLVAVLLLINQSLRSKL